MKNKFDKFITESSLSVSNIIDKVESLYDLKENFESKFKLFKEIIDENKFLKDNLNSKLSFLIENENNIKRSESEFSLYKSKYDKNNNKINEKNERSSSSQPTFNKKNSNTQLKKVVTNTNDNSIDLYYLI